MTAKEYLRDIRKAAAEVAALKAQIEVIRQEAQGVKAMVPTDMPKGGPGRDAAAMVAEAADLSVECVRRTSDLYQKKQEALSVISLIDHTEQRAVLINRYLNTMSWEEVADAMGYSVQSIFRLHGMALQALETVRGASFCEPGKDESK